MDTVKKIVALSLACMSGYLYCKVEHFPLWRPDSLSVCLFFCFAALIINNLLFEKRVYSGAPNRTWRYKGGNQ